MGVFPKIFRRVKIIRGEKNVRAEHGKTLSNDGAQHLQVQSAQATVAGAAGRKIGRERGLHQPNRMLAVAQRRDLHGRDKNRASFAGAGVYSFGGGNLPEIFAVSGAAEFPGGNDLKKYFSYPCERCGRCCRHVNSVDEMKNFDRGDGVCKFLSAENLCEIYSTRPPLCNGEFVYKKFFAGITVEEFHEIILQLCRRLREAEA